MLTEERKAEIRAEMQPVLNEMKEKIKEMNDIGVALCASIICDSKGYKAAFEYVRTEYERWKGEH